MNHLEEKSTRCRLVMANCFQPLPNETVCACDADDATKARALVRAGRRRHFAEAPAIRLCGPLIQEAYVAGLSHKSLLRTGSAIDDDIVDRLSTFR